VRVGIKLAALAGALLAVIGHDLRFYQGGEATAELGRVTSFAATATQAVPAAHNHSAELETILARPLFQPDRRPALEATASPKIGRLAGIIVSGTEKRLIFAGSSGGKPIVVKEGDHVDAEVVQSISDEQAALSGPDGVKVITPSFDAKGTSPAHPAQAEATEKKPAAAEPQSRMSRRQ
jgi:hypothetical protein